MKLRPKTFTLPAIVLLSLTGAAIAADSAKDAAAVKEKIQTLRTECVQVRNQIATTFEELNRLTVKDVDLRPQFEKYKAELVKMEAQAKTATARADSMKAKGEAFFAEWEQQVKTIQNEDIRKEAEKRLAKRKKSYGKILTAMSETKEQLVPFMSDLNDIKKLLDAELTASSVAKTKNLIRTTGWRGEDVQESLMDVEKELDRVSTELAKYK